MAAGAGSLYNVAMPGQIKKPPSRRQATFDSAAAGASRRAFLIGATAAAIARPRSLIATSRESVGDSSAELITPATQQAIDRGLLFLARQQQDDGAFGSGGYRRNTAVCSLVAMAWMAGGSTPGRGTFGSNVNRSLAFVLNSAQVSGLIDVPGYSGNGAMYGHGFATLFLAEGYGMARQPSLRDTLAQAVSLIVSTQNGEGGWRYAPRRDEADISVTACQLMALRAARNAGIFVPKETIDRTVDYVKRSQNADGGFRYMREGGESAFARSAAAVTALYGAGIYEGRELDQGLRYLQEFIPRPDLAAYDDRRYYFYGHYYAVQAMWQAGGDLWRAWYLAIRDELLTRRTEDGVWSDPIGAEYATAMATIILQTPNQLLPIFQR